MDLIKSFYKVLFSSITPRFGLPKRLIEEDPCYNFGNYVIELERPFRLFLIGEALS